MDPVEQEVMSWVDGCLQSDRKAQEALYRHFYPLLMPVCMTYVQNNDDAIDIYNRAFLKVFSSLNNYGRKGPFGAWARRIVVNTAIDFLRRNKRVSMQAPIEEADEVQMDNQILAEMTSEEILAIIRELPDSQRMVMSLFVIEGMSHAEIGEELKISPGTSKWHLNQARKYVQARIYELGILCK